MNEPNQLDDFLKRKLSQRAYEPDPAHWAAAEQLIAASQGRKQRRWGGWLWILLMFGVAGTTWGFYRVGIASEEGDPNTASTPSYVGGRTQPNATIQYPVIEQEACPPVNSSPSFVSTSGQEPAVGNSQQATQELGRTHTNAHILGQRALQEPGRSIASARVSVGYDAEGDETTGIEAGNRNTSETPPRVLGRIDKTKRAFFGIRPWEVQPFAQKVYGPGEGEYPRNGLQVEVGIALAAGWQNTGQRLRSGSALPALGVNYIRTLGRGWRASVGVRYVGRGALDSDSTYRIQTPGFGLLDTLTTISPRMLHYVAFPLRIDTRVWKRHYLQLGIQPAVLVNASGRLTRVVATDFGEEVIDERNTWGYNQGFARVDLSIMAGYRYYLGRGLRVGIGATYGLRDQTEEVFFKNPQINRNLDVRFTLEYDLWQF